MQEASSLGIDNENVTISNINLSGQDITIHQKPNPIQQEKIESTLFWTCNSYFFSIHSDIDIGELIKIASGLVK